MPKYIVHVDMDAFFAAIEQRDNPKLLNKPVVVGANPKAGRGRGVVSTCSYEAREFGLHSAMPVSTAYRKCPQAVFLVPNMEKYAKVSEEIYEILYSFSPQIEMISIDEAFLDITRSFHIFGNPLQTCRLIKSKIKQANGLTASLGLAPTKMAAKIASDIGKPDGLIEVKKEGLVDFLWPLDIDKIWGLGKKNKLTLNNMGIKTIGQLAKIDPLKLKDKLGKNAKYFWELAQGIDEREVKAKEEIKSLGNEVTFEEDLNDIRLIERSLANLSEKISSRLRRRNLKGKTISLRLRLRSFRTYTRTLTLVKATNFSEIIYKAAKKLLAGFDLSARKARLVGIKVSNLMPRETGDTFLDLEKDKKTEQIYVAIDQIKEKFGSKAIQNAASLSA